VHGAAPRTLLEVGSGFGFTRAAAEQRAIATAGVDLNPHAAAAARRLYGFDTLVGDAAAARGTFDLVLYQFVLEHLPDPAAELRRAAALVAAGGALALVVPSMDAVEIDLFGPAYRSFRDDHLHLFSRRSIERFLDGAGLRVAAARTACSIGLLRGFFAADELAALDAAGRGPDLTVLARRPS
jgi:SAM-dependent methyltransferase